MVDEVPTDQRAADVQKRLMQVCSPLVPNTQPTIAVEPRRRPLDDLPMSAEPLAAFDTPARDVRHNALLVQLRPQRLRVKSIVRMEFRRAFTRPDAALT
jgi:hypothetical protein